MISTGTSIGYRVASNMLLSTLKIPAAEAETDWAMTSPIQNKH